MERFSETVSFIWSIANLLRGDYKRSEYGRVFLPMTVLRRLDQVLAPTRDQVRAVAEVERDKPPMLLDRLLLRASGQSFYNTSNLDFERIGKASNQTAADLMSYVNGFSQNAREIMEQFRFEEQVERLDSANLLLLVVQRFQAVDLHPDRVSNVQMGYIFEEMIRKFAEESNETAGEHFTPREVIRLMVDLLFIEDDDVLRAPGVVRTMLDPACGTGGMLSVAEEYLRDLNPQASLKVYGQEINGESYAICKADMMIKGQEADNIRFGNSFTHDLLMDVKADYLISNPPFGVDWSKSRKEVKAEHEDLGHAGRFGPGLPRKNDGSLLFLLHMLSKMKDPAEGGSRLAIVFNGSPLFTGAAESGESEIRRHVLEHDLLEAIVALPDQMFYNTGINTYVWILTNRKPDHRKGKVQLINGVAAWEKMPRSLGDKRKRLNNGHIKDLVQQFAAFDTTDTSRIFHNADFGFQRITVERPLQHDYQASPERIARLQQETTWKNTVTSRKKNKEKAAQEIAEGQAILDAILRALARLDPDRLYLDRKTFRKDLNAALDAEQVAPRNSLKKAIERALGEHNPDAVVCKKKNKPEPDPDLRDYENVPLNQSIDDYMAREVLPHVPDAWVDRSATKIGYEIPFTRHFYTYTPPRPVEVIEAEIREMEANIQRMLGEVLG